MTAFVTRKIALIFLLAALHLTVGFSQATPSARSSGDQERLALLPFETKGFSSEDANRLNHNFAAGLAESKRFDVTPDLKFKDNLQQAGITNIDGCFTLSCLSQLGKGLHVEKVVLVQAEQWEQRFILHIRLIRSSDAALLYDERVDYSGDINSLSTVVVPEQGRKLAAAFLDKKPNWVLVGAVALICTGLVIWLFTILGSADRTFPQGNRPIGIQRQTNSSA